MSTTREFWYKTSTYICKFAQQFNLNIDEIYIVGSSLNKLEYPLTSLTSDMDSIIVTKSIFSLEELFFIRYAIYQELLSLGLYKYYHFKLFDEKQIEICSKVDGFRLKEIQLSKVSYFGSNLILDYQPVLSASTFCNSLLSTMVYEKFVNGRRPYNKKFNSRIQRNLELYSLLSRPNLELKMPIVDFCLDTDNLFRMGFSIASDLQVTPRLVKSFFDNYFLRLPHEYINKSSDYLSGFLSQ